MESMSTVSSPTPPRSPHFWRNSGLIASIVVLLFTLFITTGPANAASPKHSDTTTYTGKANTAPTNASSATNTHPAPPNPHPNTGVALPAHTDTSIHRPFVPMMQPIDIPLQSGSGSVVTSSDQQISITIPSNVITTTDVTTLLGSTAPIGATPHLLVTQVAPGSGSTSGGIISLGTYLFQLQDGKGHEIATGKGLSQPITLTYHWPNAHPALPLDHFFVALNGTHPVAMAATHLGPVARQPVTVQQPTTSGVTTATGTTNSTPSLIANILLTASSTTSAFTSNAPEGSFGTPDTFQNDLHTGDLTTTMPIDVPAGPGGLTPQVKLGYSSGAVSATHNVQAAAPWVGDGWNLNMGQITWSESFDGAMPTGYQWQNSWNLVDASGSSNTLIPPSTDIATFFDDTTRVYYNVNTHTYPHPVVQWHTAPESHAKIISYVGTNNVNGMPANAPCWRVWLPNGDMEEFGCTPDSLQWYPAGADGHTSYVAAWKLDLITDPNGNQIQISYDRDLATSPQSVTYPRDEVINSITWDSPSCHDANNRCTGAAWAPLHSVTFAHSNVVTHVYAGARSCGAQSNGLRCDDPVVEPAGSFGTPLLTQTQVLNDVTVKVYANGVWNTLRNYQFAYDQGALSPNAIDDPGTGALMSVAGFLLLDQVQETGTDTSLAYPPQVFKYQISASQYYEDSNYHPANQSVDCGPSWNTGKKADLSTTGCLLWSRSYNGFYMNEADNGQGMQQTFGWTMMHTNQHNSGQTGVDWTNPTVCNGQQGSGASTLYPCDMPDDNGWSHMALTSKTMTENSPTSANANNQTTGTWNYVYYLASLTAIECRDCGVGMYWGNTNSRDYQDYYDEQFRGFAFVQQVNPDGGTLDDSFYTTAGPGVYDNTQVIACYNGFGGTGGCSNDNSPDSALINAASGRAYEEDVLGPQSGGDWPLLSVTKTIWQAVCPTSTIGASPSVSFTAPNSLNTGTVTMNLNWDGNLVAEMDPYNPVMVCDVQQSKVDTYTPNGSITYNNRGTMTTNNVPYSDVAEGYDTSNWYGHVTTNTTTGNDLSSTPTIGSTTSYIWNDNITTTNTSATGTFIVDRVASSNVRNSDASVVTTCPDSMYDNLAYGTGQTSGLTRGLATANDGYVSCGTAGNGYVNGTQIRITTVFDPWGNVLASTDADANGGVAGHTGCTVSGTQYTDCTTYDSTFAALPISSANAKNQTVTRAYTNTAAFGYGLWPSSTTNMNSQTTSTTYDVLGRILTAKAPGETAAFTISMSYTTFCPATGANAPCLEVDTTQQLGGGTTVINRAFYDGMGHLVETRSPAPGSQDVVQYMLHNLTTNTTFQSQPYFVTAYTGAPGAGAYSTPDATKLGTTSVSDTLGRPLTSTDANAAVTTTSYGNICAPAGTNNDQACYVSTTMINADQHKSVSYGDALGRSIYAQDFTGNSTYTLYRTTKTQYDLPGNATSVTYADGSHQATATYDGLRRQTTATDPDLGAWTFSYDNNGNQTSSIDPRGAAGGAYAGYDGLNRLLWKSSTSNGSSPYATYSYDSTTSGNQGIGRLTSETFASGPSQSVTGSYSYVYDTRGRQTGWTMSLGSANYPFQYGYNDANQAITLTYPDGDLITTSYGAQDWLAGVTEALSGSTKTFLNTISYTGANGASGEPTSATVGNSAYQWSFTYDTDLRPTDTNVKLLSNNSTLYDEQLNYDAIGNVTKTNTTLPGGTDKQVFCYDEQNRLTWAGATGTPTCGTAITVGTLPTYQQNYSYDVLDRLTQGPAGSGYTYGDSAHLNAVTSANGYTAAYDNAGNMICRAKSGSGQSCSLTAQHGQVLTYDTIGRMLTWQSSSSSSPSTESDVYDGEGNRVQRVTTPGGSTTPTTTTFVSKNEEVSVTNGTTTTIKYYSAGPAQVESVNGSLSYLIQDHLGSVAVEMGSSGNLRGQQLFLPYGTQRYSSGFFNSNNGFTDQYTDTNSGLNYYGARYYDPAIGQFVSADTVQGPNRYAYVGGNPETFIDPTGHDSCSGWFGCALSAIGNVAGAVGGVLNTLTNASGIADDIHYEFTHPITSPGWWGHFLDASFNASLDAAGIGDIGRGLIVGGDVVGSLARGILPSIGAIGLAQATNNATQGILGKAVSTIANMAGNFGARRTGEFIQNEAGSPRGSCQNSFEASTSVATPQGEQPISKVQVGDLVLAYDLSTGKVQAEPVQHVFINHDNNLLNVTLQSDTKSPTPEKATKLQQADNDAHKSQVLANAKTETLQTTTEHPFLTEDRGWVDAKDLTNGEHVLKLNGTSGVVVVITLVSGQAIRYNLTVKDKHTYAVGNEQWVVHNTNCTPQATQAVSIAKSLRKDLVNAMYDQAPLGKTVVAVGVMNDGSWTASLNQGRMVTTEAIFQKIVEAAGGTYVGPITGDPWAGPGLHAEKYIIANATVNHSSLRGIGSSTPDICVPCQDFMIKAGWPEIMFGNPEPRP